MRSFFVSLALITIFLYSRVSIAGSVLPRPVTAGRKYHSGIPKLGAVSSLSSECSQIGIDMLKCGGNAADAAIAMEFCVGVIGMASTGLGGGGFALIRSPNGSYSTIDFRETAPAAAFQDMYNADDNLSIRGGLASGIPGELRGLEHLHREYARLSWQELIAPSIYLARNGFRVTEDLVTILQGTTDPEFLVNDPAWSMDFAPNGTLLSLGDLMKRKRYANLLEKISEEGPNAFYSGEIASATIRALQAANGTMTLEDLENYTVAIRQTLAIKYRNFKITSFGAPSSGSVVLNVLKTIEGYRTMGAPDSLDISTHRLDESIRFGYGLRTELGDPSFADNITIFEEEIITETTAAIIRSKILDSSTQTIAAYDPLGIEILQTHGTSHIVAADASGLVISLTSTINLWFGSHLMVPETGLIMNNEMNDFSVPGFSNAFGYQPSPANFIVPGKRPQSSMSPTIVEFWANNTFYFALGGVGGSYIITAVLQCLWNVLDRNMSLTQALKEPRFHDQLVPNHIEFEYAYNNHTAEFMSEKGHNITWASRTSEIQALRRLANGTFEAAGEPSMFDSGGYAI